MSSNPQQTSDDQQTSNPSHGQGKEMGATSVQIGWLTLNEEIEFADWVPLEVRERVLKTRAAPGQGGQVGSDWSTQNAQTSRPGREVGEVRADGSVVLHTDLTPEEFARYMEMNSGQNSTGFE